MYHYTLLVSLKISALQLSCVCKGTSAKKYSILLVVPAREIKKEEGKTRSRVEDV